MESDLKGGVCATRSNETQSRGFFYLHFGKITGVPEDVDNCGSLGMCAFPVWVGYRKRGGILTDGAGYVCEPLAGDASRLTRCHWPKGCPQGSLAPEH